jgi:phenylacetate-CoA ligase
VSDSVAHLEGLLSVCMEHPVRVKAQALDAFAPRTGKRRPIRREMSGS